MRHETGPSVVMNCAIRPDERRTLLVAGQESHCQMYIVNSVVVDEATFTDKSNKMSGENTVRNRKVKQNEDNGSGLEKIPNGSHANKRIMFDIKPDSSIQTDFARPEPLQRVVRISLSGKLMASGGLDGHIRVWNFPAMTKLTEIKAHSKEIDDLDFSPDNRFLVSVSKDGVGLVSSLESGSEATKLSWNPPEGIRYLFKRCRYGIIEGRKEKFRLFTLSNPLGKTGKLRGFLQQWNVETGKLNNIVEIEESLSALSVREDGRFVAVGTMFSGSVFVYVAFSLQKVLHIPHAHSMFVTGLTFLPVCNIDGPAISSNCEAAVVSISVDNRVCIHSLQYRRKFKSYFFLFSQRHNKFYSFPLQIHYQNG